MAINSKLNDQKVFMFSSVHVWIDTRIFYKQAMTLAQNGYQVDYYAIEGDTPVFQKMINVNVLPKKSRWHRPFRWYYLYKEALKSDARIYHFHDPELLLIAKKIRKNKPNAIIIYDMHEHFPSYIRTKEWIPKCIRKPMSWWIRKKEKRLMKACDAVIFAENSYAKHYAEYQGVKQEILNFPTWQPQKKVLKEEKFTFIYVGDIVIDRNVYGMIDFMAELKNRGYRDFQLKLIGPISSPLKIKLISYIDKLGIEEEVKLYGHLPYSKIWEHYSRAHIGLCLLHPHPNYIHSLATKLFEYMAAGLPSIVSDFPDWKKLIEDTNSGLTANPYNISQITDAAEMIMNNPFLYKRLGESGRTAFESKYNWNGEAQKLQQLYDRLLSK
ncbi:capsular biosynthesis protein [Bacillus cereus]|uniref:glycosyltransferase n=1 Tax=Bacillus cereus TaxID=1396 RepID=UPI000BF9BF8F|nr:glycosyltransferase [Bacillus cereus]PEX06316.1 capsular biosynthesis protein [Bacillus cereus]PGV18308.1 capsular biosynthesis protein [Bacillus cereus]